MRRHILLAIACVTLLPVVSASTVVNPADLSLSHLIPFLIAFFTALLLWKWMIPTQLSSLQVGFEIDDGLYEVHSLTKGRGGVRRLLKLQNVGFGIEWVVDTGHRVMPTAYAEQREHNHMRPHSIGR